MRTTISKYPYKEIVIHEKEHSKRLEFLTYLKDNYNISFGGNDKRNTGFYEEEHVFFINIISFSLSYGSLKFYFDSREKYNYGPILSVDDFKLTFSFDIDDFYDDLDRIINNLKDDNR